MEFNINGTESIKLSGETAQSRISPGNASNLTNGEVISARVEQISGNTVMLRTEDGRVLRATLQGEVSLAQGDGVEAVVSKSGENCVLYMLNIARAGAQANAQTAAQAAAAQSMLSGMMSVLKRNPGMDAGVAMFLTENNIADTAENVSAFSMLSQGVGIGGILGQILSAMTQRGDGPQAGFSNAGKEALIFTSGQEANGNALPASANVPSISSDVQTSGMAQYDYPAPGSMAAEANNPAILMGNADSPLAGPQTASIPAKAVQYKPAPSQTASVTAEFTPVHAQGATSRPEATQAGMNAILAPAQESGVQTISAPAQLGGTQTETVNVNAAAPGAQTEAPNASKTTILQQAPAEAGREAAGIQGALKEAQPAANTQALPMQAKEMIKESAPASPSGLTALAIEGALVRAAAPGTANKAAKASDLLADGAVAKTQGEDNARIGDIIRGIFIRPEAQNGDSIKKTAAELPQTVKALKSALVQSDINNKEVCLKYADQALGQIELGNRTMPFEYMQLPISVKDGEYRTAELYVFKRKGGKKSSGETGLTILVALDTQHIGRVETLVKEMGGAISIEFRLEQPETTNMFKNGEIALQKAIEAAGYRLTGLRYAGLETKTSVFNAAELVEVEAGQSAKGIDVRI